MIGAASSGGGTLLKGIWQPFAPNNIFEQDLTGAPRAADQTWARNLEDMCLYSDPTHLFHNYPGQTGYATSEGRKYTHAQFRTFTTSLFIVDPTTPTQKVTLLNNAGTEPRPPGDSHGLQDHWLHVPIPDPTKTPMGRLVVAEGTDGHLVIYDPTTSRMWEFWKFNYAPGNCTASYGAFIPNTKQSNGILPNNWGARATSLALIGGVITQQDLIQVARGEGIHHAIGMQIPASGPGWVPPATRSDAGAGEYRARIAELHEGQPNPAYPHTDAVPEGTYYAWPKDSRASDYNITHPIAAALYETRRVHGLFINDGNGSNPNIEIESYLSTGSPYALHKQTATGRLWQDSNITPYAPWTSTKLPALPDIVEQTADNIINHYPWAELQLIDPNHFA